MSDLWHTTPDSLSLCRATGEVRIEFADIRCALGLVDWVEFIDAVDSDEGLAVALGLGHDRAIMGPNVCVHLAQLEQNKQDGGKRKFILVQLPEPTERTDCPTFADITKERVRRVIQKLTRRL